MPSPSGYKHNSNSLRISELHKYEAPAHDSVSLSIALGCVALPFMIHDEQRFLQLSLLVSVLCSLQYDYEISR